MDLSPVYARHTQRAPSLINSLQDSRHRYRSNRS